MSSCGIEFSTSLGNMNADLQLLAHIVSVSSVRDEATRLFSNVDVPCHGYNSNGRGALFHIFISISAARVSDGDHSPACIMASHYLNLHFLSLNLYIFFDEVLIFYPFEIFLDILIF